MRCSTNRDNAIVDSSQNAVFIDRGDIAVIDRPIHALVGICRKNFCRKSQRSVFGRNRVLFAYNFKRSRMIGIGDDLAFAAVFFNFSIEELCNVFHTEVARMNCHTVMLK